jgi:hypothetical protein
LRAPPKDLRPQTEVNSLQRSVIPLAGVHVSIFFTPIGRFGYERKRIRGLLFEERTVDGYI